MRKCYERKRDEDVLMVLQLTENEGVTCKEAGQRHGMTKNAVIGLRNRIKKTIHCYDGCQKNDNMDYSLKPLWWQDVV